MKSTTHWDSYWQASNSLNSFGEGEAASGYNGELLAFWNSCFALLPANATVVDIGTGNGAIAVAARRYSDKKQCNYTIFGTDAAQINPQQAFTANPEIAGLLKTIQFYPECKTEQLPFADLSVELVTSQFAFEYAERKPALAECLRILKPAGLFTAIMHHSGSEIARDSAAGLAILTGFLQNTAFFQAARTLLTCMAEQRQMPEKPELADNVQRANHALLAIAQQIKLTVTDTDMHWYSDVMARVAKLIINFSEASISKLDAEQRNLTAFQQRLADQQQASMSVSAAEEFRQYLSALAVNFTLIEFKIDEQLFGWILKIKK
ncbi:class I SAM-dependent methyltransferase [Arsukibacterium indicum]|uniref:Methyltransferase domain-containing protein n=1 Tax=Arsukibacterium indicum TaxID=2848612 RepID=A0ABS6MH53_9GAMM|nr:class I SAM-dependent methyltransferase [Arsukibacterium indicum]MBV2128124.1 methyltransferase domain-containing protein [Arsukibacterium indicum]